MTAQPPIPRLDAGRIVWQPPPPTWRGVQASTQAEVDARVPYLLRDTTYFNDYNWVYDKTQVRYLHLTPGERIEIWRWFDPKLGVTMRAPGPPSSFGLANPFEYRQPLDLVIVSGQTGPSAKPMHPQWVRELRDQAVSAGVPFFFASWGEWAQAGAMGSYCFNPGASIHDLVTMNRVGAAASGRLLDGREWVETPEGTR